MKKSFFMVVLLSLLLTTIGQAVAGTNGDLFNFTITSNKGRTVTINPLSKPDESHIEGGTSADAVVGKLAIDLMEDEVITIKVRDNFDDEMEWKTSKTIIKANVPDVKGLTVAMATNGVAVKFDKAVALVSSDIVFKIINSNIASTGGDFEMASLEVTVSPLKYGNYFKHVETKSFADNDVEVYLAPIPLEAGDKDVSAELELFIGDKLSFKFADNVVNFFEYVDSKVDVSANSSKLDVSNLSGGMFFDANMSFNSTDIQSFKLNLESKSDTTKKVTDLTVNVAPLQSAYLNASTTNVAFTDVIDVVEIAMIPNIIGNVLATGAKATVTKATILTNLSGKPFTLKWDNPKQKMTANKTADIAVSKDVVEAEFEVTYKTKDGKTRKATIEKEFIVSIQIENYFTDTPVQTIEVQEGTTQEITYNWTDRNGDPADGLTIQAIPSNLSVCSVETFTGDLPGDYVISVTGKKGQAGNSTVIPVKVTDSKGKIGQATLTAKILVSTTEKEPELLKSVTDVTKKLGASSVGELKSALKQSGQNVFIMPEKIKEQEGGLIIVNGVTSYDVQSIVSMPVFSVNVDKAGAVAWVKFPVASYLSVSPLFMNRLKDEEIGIENYRPLKISEHLEAMEWKNATILGTDELGSISATAFENKLATDGDWCLLLDYNSETKKLISATLYLAIKDWTMASNGQDRYNYYDICLTDKVIVDPLIIAEQVEEPNKPIKTTGSSGCNTGAIGGYWWIIGIAPLFFNLKKKK